MNAAQKAEALKLARRMSADISCTIHRPDAHATLNQSTFEVLHDSLANARRIIQLLEGRQ